jgi:hypothetical protein
VSDHGKGFFHGALGCVTAVAGLITAVGSLIAVLYQTDVLGSRNREPAPAVSGPATGGGPASALSGGTGGAPPDAEAIRRTQARLEELLEQAEQRLASRDPKADFAGAAAAMPVEIANVAGFWRTPTGIQYSIQQQGAVVALQETNPLFGGVITAVGSGTLAGPNLTLAVTTAAGTTGTAHLRLSPDGSQLVGQYQDAVTGMVVPLQLFR